MLFNLGNQMDQEFRSKFTLKQNIWVVEKLKSKYVEVLFIDNEGFDV